jgi:hypothetical protein
MVCNPGSSISVVTSDKDAEILAFVCMDSLNGYPTLNCHPMKKNCTVLCKYMEVEWKCQQKRHEEAIKKMRAELTNAGEAEKLRLITKFS